MIDDLLGSNKFFSFLESFHYTSDHISSLSVSKILFASSQDLSTRGYSQQIRWWLNRNLFIWKSNEIFMKTDFKFK